MINAGMYNCEPVKEMKTDSRATREIKSNIDNQKYRIHNANKELNEFKDCLQKAIKKELREFYGKLINSALKTIANEIKILNYNENALDEILKADKLGLK